MGIKPATLGLWHFLCLHSHAFTTRRNILDHKVELAQFWYQSELCVTQNFSEAKYRSNMDRLWSHNVGQYWFELHH